jgi:O-antigen biosynthesis protein
MDVDDDIFNIPETNQAYEALHDENYLRYYEAFLGEADRIICSTQNLRSKLIRYNENTAIMPNFIDMDWVKENVYGTPIGKKDKLRIAWGGAGICHRDEFIYLKKLLEFKDVEIDLLGIDPMDLKNFNVDYGRVNVFGWMPVMQYFRFLRHRNYDLMYAPLDESEFNEAKSHIKILECGAILENCGCVCPTKVAEYKNYGLCGVDIEEAIKNIGSFQIATKEYTEQFMLHNNQQIIKEAYQ